jgi:hypothetical protein
MEKVPITTITSCSLADNKQTKRERKNERIFVQSTEIVITTIKLF